MTREMNHIEVVQRLYAAFGRGDIEAVLATLTDDIRWTESGPADVVPWCGVHEGKEALQRFFGTVSETLEIEALEPSDFIAGGDKVVVIGHERSRARPTGRRYESTWAHVFTLRDGKIAGFHQLIDTAAVAAAYRPVG